MTVLGAGFQIGTTTTASAAPMDLPLDELIKARAKPPKPSVSNADRAIGTRSARRDAAINARRGRSSSDKPTQMQIEAAVTKQANQTAIKKAAKAAKEKKPAATATLKEKVARRRQKRDVINAGAAAVVANSVAAAGGNNSSAPAQPTKNALKAARAALISANYVFPPNCTLKVVPAARGRGAAAAATPAANTAQKNNNNSNNNNSNARSNQNGQQQQQTKPKGNNNRRRGGGKA